jgi:hypothetical protein
MDLSPYVEQLRRELLTAADVGGDEARALAERLTVPLEASLRLALLSALSAAAEEITSQLAPGAVDVRLRGGDLGFVVTPPPSEPAGRDREVDPEPEAVPQPPGVGAEAEEGATARITLRLPEQLKARVEDAAAGEGFSVNTWLVRAVNRGLDSGQPARPADRPRNRWGAQHYSGWVR